MSDATDDDMPLRTVAVLGGSYGGYRAAQILAAGLPRGWRVVLVDRNSHFNHVYNLPRYAVLPGHEHKAFIPYDNLFSIPSDSDPADPRTRTHLHRRIHGTITSLNSHSFTYIPHSDSPLSFTESNTDDKRIEHVLHFDYAIYALGSHLPEPINLWGSPDADSGYSNFESDNERCPENGVDLAIEKQAKHGEDGPKEIRFTLHPTDAEPFSGMKRQGISWLRARQRRVEAAQSVVIVGGGALGIQFASDIASIYPNKRVTLLHSRKRLLPRFDVALSDEVLQGLDELGVRVILGERLGLDSLTRGEDRGVRGVRTTKGREIEGDLVLLCTGQTPNTDLIRGLDARAVDESSRMVKVMRSMQVFVPVCDHPEECDDNIELETCRGQQGEIEIAEAKSTATLSSPRTLCGTEPPSPVEALIELEEPMQTLYPHLFAIGDAADAFGAINAGHTAYYQGEVAARNVLRLVGGDGRRVGCGEMELEEYQPGPPMIKVSLGLTRTAYDIGGVVGAKEDGVDDLGAAGVWGAYGHRDVGGEEMWR